MTDRLDGQFRQAEMTSALGSGLILVSKKGKVTVKVKGRGKTQAAPARITPMSHNRQKRYILEEGIAVPFLVDLGVMTKEGRVVNSRYDKFRQINRFLEMVEDVLPGLDKGRENTIIDFGCGKSYLTFAMYYYLRELRGYQVRIIGLDLKEDVIAHCEKLARAYGYEGVDQAVSYTHLDVYKRQDVDGILITHEHSDHIKGLGVLARKYQVPIYATRETLDEIRSKSSLGDYDRELLHPVCPDVDFVVGDLTVKPFSIDHDAANPVAYRVQCGERSVAVATDMGHYDQYIIDHLRDLDALLLESNHDVRMLESGPYPYYLKRRILGDHGHLSNELSLIHICLQR